APHQVVAVGGPPLTFDPASAPKTQRRVSQSYVTPPGSDTPDASWQIAAPLTAGMTALGWAIAAGDEPAEDDVRALENVADLVAASIAQLRKMARLQDETAHQEMLGHIARIASQHLDVRELCQAITGELQSIIRFQRATLIVQDEAGTRQSFVMTNDGTPLPQPEQDPLNAIIRTRLAIPYGNPLVAASLENVSDPSRDERALRDQGLYSYACVLLQAHGQRIGAFGLAAKAGDAFQPADLELLGATAHHFAGAIWKALLYRKEQRQRHLTEALAQISQSVNSTLSLDKVLKLALEQLSHVMTYDTASIFLAEGSSLCIVACRGFDQPDDLMGTVFRFEENNIAHEAMLGRRAHVVADVQMLPNWGHTRDDVEGAHTIRSWIGAPLIVHGESIGILTIDKYEPNFYKPEDGDTAAAFAVQIATAIHNARLYESERIRRRTALALTQIAQTINSTLEPVKVLDMALDQLRSVIDYDTASILLLENGNLVIAACRGFDSPEHVIGTMITPDRANYAHMTLVEQCTRIVEDVQAVTDWSHARDDIPEISSIRSWIGAPLIVRGESIGVLTIDKHEPHFYKSEDGKAASVFAAQFATAIQNARLYQAVARQRDRLASILTDATDAVIVVDPNSMIWLVNPAAEHYLHLEHLQVAGRPLHSLNLPGLDDAFTSAQARQAPEMCEVVTADGTAFHASLAPVRDVGWVIVMQDITPLKELDRLRTDWVAAVSHDLKNPIQVIQMGAAMLELDAPLNAEQIEHVQMIQRSAMQLSDLVTNVLDLARLEAGPTLRLVSVNPPSVIHAAMSEIEHLASEKRQHLELDLAPSLPPLLGDESLLRRMLANLLSNAIKYTPEGGSITVRAHTTNGDLQIEIADNGPGIPPDALPHLFDRFYRVPNTTANGTGLGLSIVKSIIDKHNGSVQVSSTPGQGSTFTVRLPASKAS
ncbi:MAG TPA: GAF domain-containing protein, partial [Aggregatilinea sp.]|uniref:GAF domain-containing sensor histidine kinase n=1 Tax=Aggregatilinea sp. TaxID=2806333 RepID=UPI002B6A826E